MGGWEAGMGPRASQEEDGGSRGGKAEPVIKGGAGGMWGAALAAARPGKGQLM